MTRITTHPKNFNSISTQSLLATEYIEPIADIVRISGNGGAVTMTSTPTIANGFDGQRIILHGSDSLNTVTVQDDDVLSGTALKLDNGVTLILGEGDILELFYCGCSDSWIEISRSDN